MKNVLKRFVSFFLMIKPKNWFIFKNEYKTRNFIPYDTYWNKNTVLTKNHDLLQIIEVNGFFFETADDEDLEIQKDLRNSMLRGLSSPDMTYYTHLIRRKEKAYPDDYYDANMPEGFASYLDNKWAKKHQQQQAFVNSLYITIMIKGAGNAGFINKILQKFGLASDNWAEVMRDKLEQLEDASGRIMGSMRSYGARMLEVYETNNEPSSSIAAFFARIINCGDGGRLIHSPVSIDSQLSFCRLFFGSKSIKIFRPDGKVKYAGVVSIKEYGPRTWPGMLDSFLKMPYEFIVSQSFEFANKQTAINAMQLQQNRMIQGGDKAISQIGEITEALDKAMSGSIVFGKHHLSITCIAENEKLLENNLSSAVVELTNTGGIGVRETVNMEPAFWAQLPGNGAFLARKATINSMNLSSFASMHNYPIGQAEDNFWGKAVTVLDTTSDTPYYFNFHLRDVGHTMIIGPTGAGKTVMLNFLCAQAQKFQPQLFFFDKDRGAEIFVRAINGRYTIIDPGKACGLNPLQLPDTGENRSFLIEWMKYLVTANGEQISAEDAEKITAAVNGNYKLDKKDRKLSNIAPFFGIGGPGSLAGRLAMWHSGGSHASVFDNDEDVIDFSKSSTFAFEMAELLRDKVSLGPVLTYIFHRINISLTGAPSMIVLDEAWALIDNPIFAPKIKDWLKVLRKLNTFVVFATQSVEDASKSAISDTLIQQTATQIFLPNLKATDVYKTAFMLSEREFALVKTTDPGSRFFLVKQGNDSVMARINLSGMDDIINILSGRAETVSILDDVLKEYGNNPEVWISKFNERVMNGNSD